MQFRYNDNKNTKLESEHKIDFEQIIDAALAGYILGIGAHPNHTKEEKCQ